MNKEDEEVIAVIETDTVEELELTAQISDIERTAQSLVICNDASLCRASEIGRAIKTKISEVQGFFAPMKKAADEAHKQIVAREKQALEPLKKAESILKQSVSNYIAKCEMQRREAEETAKRIAEAEAQKKLAEAVAYAERGEEEASKEALLDAQMAEQAVNGMCLQSATPKASGMSVKTDWEIVSIDEGKVPVDVAGIVIRPVNQAEVLRLIRQCKGRIKIDGIEYRETIATSFRRM